MPKFIDYIGPHTLDLAPLQGKLVDIEEGGMQGLRLDQPGFQAMVLSLAKSMPLYGTAAGIAQDVYDHFVASNDTVATIDERLAIAKKQVEVLEESRAFHVDARQNDVSLMVDAMRSRAQRRKDPSLLIPFENVIKYNAQVGDKAFKTRKKNAQAKADAQAQAKADAQAQAKADAQAQAKADAQAQAKADAQAPATPAQPA
jgi:hypothetical protein